MVLIYITGQSATLNQKPRCICYSNDKQWLLKDGKSEVGKKMKILKKTKGLNKNAEPCDISQVLLLPHKFQQLFYLTSN